MNSELLIAATVMIRFIAVELQRLAVSGKCGGANAIFFADLIFAADKSWLFCRKRLIR